MLYASVNPEYFSAADGKQAKPRSLPGEVPDPGAFRSVANLRGRGLHYFEVTLASNPSLLTHFFFIKVFSGSLSMSKILGLYEKPQRKTGFRGDWSVQ